MAKLKSYTLQEIEKIMLFNGATHQDIQDSPQPSREGIDNSNRLVVDELRHNLDSNLQEKHDEWFQMLNIEQRGIYDEITGAVFNDLEGVFGFYGFRGTGKIFMWKTLAAAIRCRGHIVLNVASSGIASLLLKGGKTTHSRSHLNLILLI